MHGVADLFIAFVPSFEEFSLWIGSQLFKLFLHRNKIVDRLGAFPGYRSPLQGFQSHLPVDLKLYGGHLQKFGTVFKAIFGSGFRG